ncbi:MAG: helix-turn-helix domain-containing protein [Polymorphobacter sp.]|uniref:helix-turn-helix domain-containing protein n=1 Tax=Polymorphobacter sp. TaxID=1909290 RepID=UPI003A864D9A
MTPADMSEDGEPALSAGGAARAGDADGLGDGETTTGRLLMAARIRVGRTIEDIASETRVPMRHLRAIEADEHEALPALPYSQGFVRSFAAAVGLNGDALATRFRAETKKQPHMPRAATIQPLDERRLPGRAVLIGSLAALVVLVGGLSAWSAGVFDAPVPDAPLVSAAAPAQALRVTPPPPEVPVDTVDAAGAAAPEAGEMVLTATEDVWVRVYDPASALVPISRVMRAGERFAVPAEPSGLMLWTGKAGALEVRVGEALLPPLGGRSQTLRDIRLTPEALRAQAAAAAGAGAASGVTSSGGAVEPVREDLGV